MSDTAWNILLLIISMLLFLPARNMLVRAKDKLKFVMVVESMLDGIKEEGVGRVLENVRAMTEEYFEEIRLPPPTPPNEEQFLRSIQDNGRLAMVEHHLLYLASVVFFAISFSLIWRTAPFFISLLLSQSPQ